MARRGFSRRWAIAWVLATLCCFWMALNWGGASFSPSTQYSFLPSLQLFLADQGRRAQDGSLDQKPVQDRATLEDVTNLDRALLERDEMLLRIGLRLPLNVYVYEMPSKFTTDLLWLFQKSLEETVNVTSNGSPVHRLIEQHSVDYWLYSDLMAPESERRVKTVRRVREVAQADVFYIPMFTTIPFFLLDRPRCKQLYREAVKWITGQAAWQRSGGRDHVLALHHPWSMKSHRRFLKTAIWLLPDLDSTGNWYKAGEVSVDKDVVLPYVPNVEACDSYCLAHSLPLRKTLLFFRGRTIRNAGGKVRSKLADVLHEEVDVIIEEGSNGQIGKLAAQNGMRRAVFCLSPAGDTPSSARLFDAIVSGCIPVVVSDELELPFEGILDYRKVAVFVAAAQAVQKGWLVTHLHSISAHDIAAMQLQLAQFTKHFQYASPAQPLGPEDLTWRMVAGKLQDIKLHVRRSQRLVTGARNECTCGCNHANLSAVPGQYSA